MDEENNSSSNTPSTSSDVMPKGGGVKQGAKNVARKGWNSFKDAVGRGIRAIWNVLPMQVKIIVIVVIVILILVLSLLLMGMIEEGTTVANNNVGDYISSATDIEDSAKSLYTKKSSLLKMKLSDINKIYDKFVNDDQGGAETQTLMQYEIGSNKVNNDKSSQRVVDVDDKLPLYKHILLTEKYNFNKINWDKYTHENASAGTRLKDNELKEDKELGLKYPNDSSTDLDKFINLTLPYLQTWYIPLAMSNASIVSGTEENSSRAPAFSYNIIKEAYSNIVVNWYELKKHTLVTKYQTYDEVKKHDTLTNITVTMTETTDDKGKKTYGYSVNTSNMNVTPTKDDTKSYNTSTDTGLANGKKDPMKESEVSKQNTYTSSYYIKQADVFDAKIINDFNYMVYSDSDAASRINADSSNETKSSFSKEGKDIKNKSGNFDIGVDYNGNLTFSNGAVAEKITQQGSATEQGFVGPLQPGVSVKVYTYQYSVVMKPYYEYENCFDHTVTRVWKDKLSQSGSETTSYTIDDLISFNESDDRKEKVTAEMLCGSSYVASTSISQSATKTYTGQISYAGRTYPIFNQNNFKSTTKHGGSSIAMAGCGLCSITTIISGMTGKNVDPKTVGDNIGWTGPISIKAHADVLKNKYNIDCTAVTWGSLAATQNNGDNTEKRRAKAKSEIINNLKNGNPVFILVRGNWPDLGTPGVGHYIAIVGLTDDGKVIMANSAGGYRGEATIDYITEAIFRADGNDEGYILVKGATSQSSGADASESTQTGTGKWNVSKSNSSQTGYESIFTSGTTGREFKEYRQNISGWNTKYNISSVGCNWTSECGTVSTIIIGSGYTENANFKTATKKLKDNKGQSTLGAWLKDYTGKTVKSGKPSLANFKKALSEGCVAMVHSSKYSNAGHYMAVLDINKEQTKVYLSNPWEGSSTLPTGWISISELYRWLDEITLVANTGEKVDYPDDDSSTSGDTDTVCNDTKSAKYYNNLKKTDGLNRIDFINSNPEIFHRYMEDGAEYYEYVGYSRSKLTLSYWNMKELLKEVAEKNDGTLPWAYGKTLGIDNTYDSEKSSSSKTSSQMGIFTWPVPEYANAKIKLYNQLTSTYGNRTNPITGQPGQNHSGIDIAHSINTSAKIVAAADGTVMKAGDTNDGYGNCVVIQHEVEDQKGKYYTLYGHMAPSSLKVKVGDKVKKGQVIGIMGTTGASTGNHLHFEIIQFEEKFSMTHIYGPGHKNCLDPVEFFNEDCTPISGSGEVVTEKTPSISNSEKQKYISQIDSDVKKANGNTDWGTQNGAWTLGYYKDNDIELIARIINHELSLTDANKDEEGARELVKCKTLIMKKRANNNGGSVYKAIIAKNQFYSKTTSSGDRFNATPPQWVRELVAAMWTGAEEVPSYWDDDAYYWIGKYDTGSWHYVTQIVGIKYNNGSSWHVLAKTGSNTRTVCSPILDKNGNRTGYKFTSTKRVPGYTDVYQ